jgi:hypothetical protein
LNLSRVLVVGGLAVLLLSAAVTTADERRSHRNGVPEETSLRITGGVLRKTGGDWRVYDPHHAHLGVGALTCATNGVLHVAFDPAGLETGFGVVVPDEKLAALGVTVGVSGSRDQLRVYFYRGFLKNGNARRLYCSSPLFDTPGSNLWLTWTQNVPEQPEESEEPG